MSIEEKQSTCVPSKVSDVTVFLSGAQIGREGKVTCGPGNHILVFKHLPVYLVAGSIQASSKCDITILSVEHRIDYLNEAIQTEEIAKLQTTFEELTDQYNYESSQIEICNLEAEMLLENRKLAGETTGLKISDLREAVAFYNERMEYIKSKVLQTNKKLASLNKEMSQIRNQLSISQSVNPNPESEVILHIVSTQKTDLEVDLYITYFIQNAGWIPLYDIRVQDVSKDVILNYKGDVYQNTKEDWDQVNLTLSSGSPSENGICPELNPWYIDFDQGQAETINQYQSFNSPMVASVMKKRSPSGDMCLEMEECPVEVMSAVLEETLTNIEYAIPMKSSIPAGNKKQAVEIITHTLPAEYQYISIRKLKKDVYLLAKVKDWERLNLIAGEANVFFENRYIGKTHIDPRRASETIELSMGIDKSVIVTRLKGRDFTAKTLIGNSMKHTREWEITVRNLKGYPIEIKVLDQIPVSSNKQIQVELLNDSGAEYNKDTGILTWDLKLDSAEAKVLLVKYIVTNPKNTVILLD